MSDARSLLNLEEGVTYLNCAYLAPQLKAVRHSAVDALERLSRPWELTPDDFFEPCDRFRALGARLVGARAEDMAIVPSVSYGISTAARIVPLRKGNRVLVLAEQFPSNYYPWERRCREEGAELVTVPRSGDWTAALLERMDAEVAVVAIPQCHWTDATAVDLTRVGEACREVGAAFVVDGTQSVGAGPLDVSAFQPDFLVWATYKWCFGPYGMSLMYVHPRWQQSRPLEENWINRKGSRNFAGLVDYESRYADGACRFDVGERSHFVLIPMAIAALTQVLDWSPEAVLRHNGELTRYLGERAGERGWKTTSSGSHFTGIEVGEDSGSLAAALKGEKIFVSVRGTRIRVAPHLHSSKADMDRLLKTMETHLPVGGA